MHARGIGTLIEQRGPAAHAEGWDASMILAFRGVLVRLLPLCTILMLYAL